MKNDQGFLLKGQKKLCSACGLVGPPTDGGRRKYWQAGNNLTPARFTGDFQNQWNHYSRTFLRTCTNT